MRVATSRHAGRESGARVGERRFGGICVRVTWVSGGSCIGVLHLQGRRWEERLDHGREVVRPGQHGCGQELASIDVIYLYAFDGRKESIPIIPSSDPQWYTLRTNSQQRYDGVRRYDICMVLIK